MSTEITGWPSARKDAACLPMCSNWASRSGCEPPSRVLALACSVKPSPLSSFATSECEILKPCRASSAARLRQLFDTHSSGLSGSPRVAGRASAFSAASSPGCAAAADLRPPPARRTRPASAGSDLPSSSSMPRPIVERAMPVAFATASIPPWPSASASFAAHSRRILSSRCGDSLSNFFLRESADL